MKVKKPAFGKFDTDLQMTNTNRPTDSQSHKPEKLATVSNINKDFYNNTA